MLTDTQRTDLKTALDAYQRAIADWDTYKLADTACALSDLHQHTLSDFQGIPDELVFLDVLERCLDERGQADAEKWVAAALLILEAL